MAKSTPRVARSVTASSVRLDASVPRHQSMRSDPSKATTQVVDGLPKSIPVTSREIELIDAHLGHLVDEIFDVDSAR